MVGAVIRVLHVIQELRTGGAERVVLTLARAGFDAGDDVAVAAAPGELDDELPARCRRYELPVLHRNPWRVPVAAWRLRSALHDFAPDVTHVHNPAMALVAAFAGCRRRPTVVSVHGVPEEDWTSTGRLLRAARLPVVGCGPGISAGLRAAGCEPMATVPNGVSPAPAPMSGVQLRAELGLPEDCQLVVVVGRLVPQKNQQLAIRALTTLPSRVRLVLVGEGASLPELEATAREHGVVDRVVFAGRRPGRPVMAAADVVCVPSRWEGMPLVGLEAMSSGRPLVVTAVRGSRELVEDGRTGLVVAPDDPAALSAAISRLLDDPTLSERLAAAAAEVAAGCSDEAMTDAYAALYRDLVARRSAA